MSTKTVVYNTGRNLDSQYQPESFETEIYRFWESERCFEAASQNAKGQKSFCIMIPPPNVTGVLHMGHALTTTIQDILVRWHRMKGDNTLWLPGTDHAGIATQAQVEKDIAKTKGADGKPLTRHDLGREKFLERTWKWKEDHHGRIVGQLKKMGSSYDWSRERFTMDEGCSRAVREVFTSLYEEGLIYRGERIINWCWRCQTALSDLEVVPKEKKGFFWHIEYPVVEKDGTPIMKKDGKPESIIIATTRPETLLGDTAIAIHPEDKRYTHLHGKFAKLPLLGRIIPIIQDEYVDKEFGRGALKVTPAHDFNDYDIGKRHQLPLVIVIGKDGKMTAAAGQYSGLFASEARQRVIQDLKVNKELIETEDHVHKVGTCQRCEYVAEPMISKQWFVKILPLAKPAIEAVETGKTKFYPKTWEKTYFEWMYNIRDWCISRQLWWGHQIPAWYCGQCQEVTVSRTDPTQCSHCKAPAEKLTQDPDVLDTWFSSGLWPFATLGWPEKTDDLKTFYPTSILETGFDIIFFWVARMMMMGIHFMKDIPFERVYLHAMVRDEKGEKMSKSKGNVIDPLDIISQYGADPLRFTFAVMAGQGRDIKLSLDRVEGYRGFCNKFWNATKYFLMQFDNAKKAGVDFKGFEKENALNLWIEKEFKNLNPTHQWIISDLQLLIQKVEEGFESFELNNAAQALYDFTWHELCDWFVELSKLPFKENDLEGQKQTVLVLRYVLEETLKCLHPIVPHVTEELWQTLPWKTSAVHQTRNTLQLPAIETIMLQRFPVKNDKLISTKSVSQIGALKKIIEALRVFRGENQISPKKDFPIRYYSTDSAVLEFVKSFEKEIQTLAKVSELTLMSQSEISQKDEFDSVIPLTDPKLEIRISLKGLVDVQAEKKRIDKEIATLEKDLMLTEKKLSNPKFVERAPQDLVLKEKNRIKEIKTQIEELKSASIRIEKLA